MFNSGCSSSYAKNGFACRYALALALFSASPTRAQVSGATLSGLITDENGGPSSPMRPSASRTLVLEAPRAIVVTNADGFCSALKPTAS